MSSKVAASKGKKAAADTSSSSGISSDSDNTKKKVGAAARATKAAPKKKAATSSDSSASDSESDDDAKAKSKAKAKPAPAAAKKPTAAKKKAAASSSSEESDSDDDKPAAKSKKPAPKAAAAPTKKPAAAKPAPNAFAGLNASDDDDDADSESEESDAAPAKKKSAAKKGGKKVESSSESEEEEATTTAKKPAGKAAAKGGKGAPAKDEDEDLDAILNDLSLKPSATTETTDESKMTKAQLKRLRQKQKQEAEKAAGPEAAAAAKAEEKKPEEKKPEAKKAAEKPAKAGNKAVEALKEKLRVQREEEERRRKEEEDRLAAIEEERKRLEEEERQAAEDKLRRQEARAKAREVARAEGKLLSKTEKAAQAKREAFLKQLAASGAVLPDALKEKKADGDDKADGEEAGEAGAATTTAAPKQSKKDQHKKKSAFGKRLEAQKEAERIRAERYAQEDASRAAQKEEEQRRKLQDAELAKKHAAALAQLDAEEAELEDPPVGVQADEDVAEPEEEEVADSWEDVDSEEDRRKATEKEERRAKKIEERVQQAAERARGREKLAKKREEMAHARDAELADLKKKRDAVDHERKRAAEEAKKAAVEEERTAKAIEGGFEIEQTEVIEESAGGKEVVRRKGDLRSPIACILGHVDTGKTKILDKIRQSSVQSGEAGGITQQIGASFLPRANILEKTAELNKFLGKELKMTTPGLLMIDTPGHESFNNLRSRGSSLCDIAILVIDIMHGLEPQTIESINLLKQRKTPFIIALNKIDRCYGWKPIKDAPFQVTYNTQSDTTKQEFQKRTAEAVVLMAQQGLNVVPYYENTDFRKWISVVPTSAITGEGIPDLLMLLVQLTQVMMPERLSYVSELACTVLEVKVVEGLGTTIDVILVNGVLNEGDTIVVCGLTGPIVTTIRALLTPPPMHEIRIKSEYIHHKTVRAAMGVKISAQGLETAIAGSALRVCTKKDDIEELKDEVQGDLATILSRVDKSGQGVAVQASTLGSLEALLAFLEQMKIPVSTISIGPVYKRDIMKAAVMLEKRPEFGVLLAFDVKVSPDAQKIADDMGVKIFTADIIYHLFDACTKWMADIKEKKRVESAEVAVFPCVLDILPNSVFNVKSPIVLGVRVVEGVARIGTPICIPSKSFLFIGKITGIQKNHQDFQEAKKGEEFACKFEQSKSDQQVVFGRQFDASCQLVSRITRESIDLLKANFKDDLTDAEWRLVVKLKKVFEIM